VIEGIECFHTQLEVNSFGEVEGLIQSDIPVVDSRLAKNIASAVAELTGRG